MSADVILVYHAIGRAPADVPLHNSFVPVELFRRQLAHAQRVGEVVPLDVLLGGEPGTRRKIAITFDDGYRTALTHAAPLLERLGLPATFFIPTLHLGRRNAWDGPSELDLDIITADEIVDLDRRGFEIGSHGHAHVDLSLVDDAEARRDITTSVDVLTSILGRRPRFLAFPYGRSTEAVRTFAAEHFSAALAMEQGGGRFAMTRTPVYPRDRRALFALKASGRYARWRHTPLVEGSYAAVRPLVRRGQQ